MSKRFKDSISNLPGQEFQWPKAEEMTLEDKCHFHESYRTGFKPDWGIASATTIADYLTQHTQSAPVSKKLLEYEKRIADLEKTVQKLSEYQEGPSLPAPGEFESWIESKDADQYAGKHIAYVLGKGVVASSDKLGALSKSVADHPNRKEIRFAFVPA
jgi:hypothetical protein